MKLIPQDQAARDSLLAALFLNAFLLVFVLMILPKLPPVIPLFYSRPWGEDQLVPKLLLLTVPLASFAIFLANFFITKSFSGEKSLLLLRILSFAALAAALLGSITVLRIALVVS